MKQKISISVVFPAYNAEKTLARALESVLAQTQSPNEIIVVDEASTVHRSLWRSPMWIGTSAFFAHESAMAQRQLGIWDRRRQRTAGRFLDADDERLPAKLEKHEAASSAHPDATFVLRVSEKFSFDGQSAG